MKSKKSIIQPFVKNVSGFFIPSPPFGWLIGLKTKCRQPG
jgi:hypothetical protein